MKWDQVAEKFWETIVDIAVYVVLFVVFILGVIKSGHNR